MTNKQKNQTPKWKLCFTNYSQHQLKPARRRTKKMQCTQQTKHT